ncbi:transglycosylase SLT domain-containing protein [Aestuariirhabdus sp. Z084]|uniref:transglycosylase SLT domain-containing protein n=1 Tax=Aestuariirhabdus haliotis TaxID=2918751 RepID=UPI00201B388C|nr:transglycosylase SLT domain-containing protein [Aestuariirhabdus haliotis]MCL6414744.1 transglycosylase SLT domain-containing protein [Aestuariirhabdus haliotis]MCL6418676.1 transglycosylase SLT domain-containing protein [Aestuariirhabdus haliotis]
MRRAASVAILLAGLVCSLSGFANIPQATLNYDQERVLYEQTLHALSKGKIGTYKRLRKQLTHYPLYPYLVHRDLMRRLYTLPNKDIADFISQYPDLPVTKRLQQAWLKKLGQKSHWRAFEDHYDPAITNDTLRCYLHRAQLARSDYQSAWSGAKTLWLSGKSRPDACDPLFKAWHSSGELSADLVWQRMGLAYEKRNGTLGKYLIRFLPEDQKALGQLYRSVYRRPEQLANTLRFSPSGSRFTDIIYIGLHRLAYKDPAQALDLWVQYQAQRPFAPDRESTINDRISLYMLKQFDNQALPWIEQVTHQGENIKLIEWRIRLALREQDWASVLKWIDQLPESKRSNLRWKYWSVRAREALEPVPAPDYYTRQYRELANDRSFYGFVSASHIGSEYKITHHSARLSPPELDAVSALPAIQRAHEFYQLNDLTSARREWHYLSSRLSTSELIAAARIAHKWKWFNQAIRSAISAQQWDDMELRFPLAYKEKILKQSQHQNINSSWVFAVARQESAFMHDARSSAGALGVLQLMPSTARQVARRGKLSYRGKRDLLNPATNIKLGSRYLAQLLKQFNGNRVLATAAYNAGPHRVRQWLKNGSEIPFDIWIETIPFEETRQYVQNVLSFSVIYDDKLGNPTQLLSMDEVNHGYGSRQGLN